MDLESGLQDESSSNEKEVQFQEEINNIKVRAENSR
jgi:hypothetical protein